MSSFTDAVTVPTGLKNRFGRDTFRVQGAAGDGFWFYVGNPEHGLGVHVPEGFITDGPSVPPWLLRLMPGWLRKWVLACLAKAAIVHDLLRSELEFTLVDCDAMFLVAMTADMPNWSGPRLFCWILRELSFALVRTNTSRG